MLVISYLQTTKVANDIYTRLQTICARKDRRKGTQKDVHERAKLQQQQTGKKSGWTILKEALAREGSLKRIAGEDYKEDKKERTFSFLSGEESHKVWKPKLSFFDIVAKNMKERLKEDKPVHHYNTVTLPQIEEEAIEEPSLSVKSLNRDLHRRRKTRMDRVNFAWKVLQENPSSTVSEDIQPKLSGKERWRSAAKKVSGSIKKQKDFSLIVADLLAKEKAKQL